MNPIPTRYLREIGTVHRLRRYWEDSHPCKGWSYHNAFEELGRTYTLDDHTTYGSEKDYSPSAFPTQCHHCGHVWSESSSSLQVFRKRLFVASNGAEVAQDEMVPGDLFYLREHAPAPGAHYRFCHGGWTNCNGMHLHCVLPDGTPWDIDSRCSNCTMRDDTLHRCWVRHGDPEHGETVHVDKSGLTCAAGGGSIVVPGFHGFLHHGKLLSV